MVEPKIIFRDISSQHFSATQPVYEELKRQGFNCEVQLLKVPRINDLLAFAAKHENDAYDLLVTASLTRYIFAKQRVIQGRRYGPEYFRALERRKKAIYMAHGVGGEELPDTGYYEFLGVFLVGQYWMDLFTRFSAGDFPNIHLIGMPKLDLMMSPKRFAVAKKLADELDLLYDKTVLYVPTLRRLDSSDITILHLLKIMEELEVNLLIKHHCDDIDEKHRPFKFLITKAKAKEMKNVRWIDPTVPSIVPYYLVSDVALSGNSSCLREFMLTDKPSIQLTNVPDYLKKKFFYEGCVQSSIDDLRANILHTIYVPETMQEERQREIKRLFHKPDGHATDRAVKRIKEIMKW